ncbi:MAG: LysM peptidoglycan-binding domain-containing protein [Anaerolineales bacterium]|nr:LysM peptidoglycan-binding domain-containing protein [Anaerolineales bacterium]
MSEKPAYKRIESYRRRQRYGPFIVGAIAIVLVVVGLIFILLWWRGSDAGVSMFATETPTPTVTNTPVPPTETATITMTPTITEIPTEAATPTAAAPFLYTIQEGDTLTDLAIRFGLDELEGPLTIMLFNNMTSDSFLVVGEQLIIPDPNTGLPTATPLPEFIPRGSLIVYIVRPGDSLASIASEFLSTEDAILAENEDLVDPNQLFVGQQLFVPYGLVTPTRTPTETLTPNPLTPTLAEFVNPTETPTPSP